MEDHRLSLFSDSRSATRRGFKSYPNILDIPKSQHKNAKLRRHAHRAPTAINSSRKRLKLKLGARKTLLGRDALTLSDKPPPAAQGKHNLPTKPKLAMVTCKKEKESEMQNPTIPPYQPDKETELEDNSDTISDVSSVDIEQYLGDSETEDSMETKQGSTPDVEGVLPGFQSLGLEQPKFEVRFTNSGLKRAMKGAAGWDRAKQEMEYAGVREFGPFPAASSSQEAYGNRMGSTDSLRHRQMMEEAGITGSFQPPHFEWTPSPESSPTPPPEPEIFDHRLTGIGRGKAVQMAGRNPTLAGPSHRRSPTPYSRTGMGSSSQEEEPRELFITEEESMERTASAYCQGFGNGKAIGTNLGHDIGYQNGFGHGVRKGRELTGQISMLEFLCKEKLMGFKLNPKAPVPEYIKAKVGTSAPDNRPAGGGKIGPDISFAWTHPYYQPALYYRFTPKYYGNAIPVGKVCHCNKPKCHKCKPFLQVRSIHPKVAIHPTPPPSLPTV